MSELLISLIPVAVSFIAGIIAHRKNLVPGLTPVAPVDSTPTVPVSPAPVTPAGTGFLATHPILKGLVDELVQKALPALLAAAQRKAANDAHAALSDLIPHADAIKTS